MLISFCNACLASLQGLKLQLLYSSTCIQVHCKATAKNLQMRGSYTRTPHHYIGNEQGCTIRHLNPRTATAARTPNQITNIGTDFISNINIQGRILYVVMKTDGFVHRVSHNWPNKIAHIGRISYAILVSRPGFHTQS